MIQAAVMHGAGEPVRIEEFPEPVAGPGEIVLSTIYSEVCGTDVHLKHGRLAGVPYPIIPGHFSVGTVAQVNGEIVDINGHRLAEGDTVTFLDVHGSCHRCWQCLVARSTTKCPDRRVYGVSHSTAEGLLGGWSQKILLKADVHAIRLPADISPLRFIAGGCALPTALHAIERAQLRIGDRVVVQGAGPVGLSAAILAREAGADQVVILDRSPARLLTAATFGLDTALVDEPHAGAHVQAALDAIGGRGADVVIEATGVPRAVSEGTAMCRDGGCYVIVGHYTDTGEVTLNPHRDINRKHLEIRGTWGIDFRHFHAMLGVLRPRSGRDIPWEALVGTVYGLHDIERALDDVAQARIVKAVIAPNRHRSPEQGPEARHDW